MASYDAMDWKRYKVRWKRNKGCSQLVLLGLLITYSNPVQRQNLKYEHLKR